MLVHVMKVKLAQFFKMLQFLLTTSSRQLTKNPCINTPWCLTPLSCILLNTPLGTRNTMHETTILNEIVQNISLVINDAT